MSLGVKISGLSIDPESDEDSLNDPPRISNVALVTD